MSLSWPDSNCSILTTSKNIVLVSVDCSDGTSMCICDLPNLCSLSNIETSQEPISPSSKHSLVILCCETTNAPWGFCGHQSNWWLVFGQIPQFQVSKLVDRHKTVAIVAEGNVIYTSAVSVRAYQKRQVVRKHSENFTGNSSNDQLFAIVAEIDRHHLAVQLGFMRKRPLAFREVDFPDFTVAASYIEEILVNCSTKNSVRTDWHTRSVNVAVHTENANLAARCSSKK